MYLVFGVYLTLCIFLLLIVYKILKRNPKNRLNQLFSLFYLSLFISVLLNCIYITFSDPSLQSLASLLNVIAFFIACLAAGFLSLCILLLYKPLKMTKTKNQVIFILIYGCILSVLFFIPDGSKIVILSSGLQLSPVWNFMFFAYSLTIFIILLIISLLISTKVYKQIQDEILAKRFKFFIIGIFIFYYIPIGVTITNYLDNPLMRLLFAMTATIIFVGAIFIYYGIGTKLEEI